MSQRREVLMCSMYKSVIGISVALSWSNPCSQDLFPVHSWSPNRPTDWMILVVLLGAFWVLGVEHGVFAWFLLANCPNTLNPWSCILTSYQGFIARNHSVRTSWPICGSIVYLGLYEITWIHVTLYENQWLVYNQRTITLSALIMLSTPFI